MDLWGSEFSFLVLPQHAVVKDDAFPPTFQCLQRGSEGVMQKFLLRTKALQHGSALQAH